jgi:N-carbamoyl-L-amino-acid hydrolase
MTEPLHINQDRLQASLTEFAAIGATPGGGVTRLAMSEEDRQARDLLRQRMSEAGLTVRIDDLGNITGRRDGTEPGPAVILGSHLDTVERGGRYDGALGVLGALEVVRTLNDHGLSTRLPIEVVNWTDEEGARFQPANMASGIMAGAFTPDELYERRDRDGIRFLDELRRHGYLGEIANRPGPATAYLELHIEQGPALEAAGLPVGVVEGVVGIIWSKVTIAGQANHVGTTPMTLRHDALAAAAQLIAAVETLGRETPGAVATVGRLSLQPNNPGVIPGLVECIVDFCHQDEATLEALATRLLRIADDLDAQRGVTMTIERIWTSQPAPFPASTVDLVADACQLAGYPAMRLWSGAGHDAMYMQRVCPTGMIFVRSKGGLSHSEAEYSTPDDLAAGTNVLFRATLVIAEAI